MTTQLDSAAVAALPDVEYLETDWLDLVEEALQFTGGVVVHGVATTAVMDDVRRALYATQTRIHEHIGLDRLDRAGELGVLRAPMAYDDCFFGMLELPAVLGIVDRVLSPTAILHLQNGFILPPGDPDAEPRSFQHSYHRDFPRHLDGFVASLNVLVAVDEFRTDNGATLCVPGTHQRAERPSDQYLRRNAAPAVCPSGSAVVFDSTLWHAAGRNVSGQDRCAVNMQFTHSWIKQQIDYVRTLGDETVEALPDRTQQLLGYYTRVVTSLDEYYVPSQERRYRAGQG